ncbi:MAG: hypothetical protein ABIG36_05805 [Pseudomonadota bacterium]
MLLDPDCRAGSISSRSFLSSSSGGEVQLFAFFSSGATNPTVRLGGSGAHNALLMSSMASWADFLGRNPQTSSVAGQTTTYTYDGVGQLTGLTRPDGIQLSYDYDPAHRLTAIADGAGNRVEFTLDALGNITRTDWVNPDTSIARSHRAASANFRQYPFPGCKHRRTCSSWLAFPDR